MFDDDATDGMLRIAFVELPDEALDVMSHFTQRADGRVMLVVSQDPQSFALRMAEILQVPMLDIPTRMAFLSCTHVIVGPHPHGLLDEVRELLGGSRVEVLSLAEALDRFGVEGVPVGAEVEPDRGVPGNPVTAASGSSLPPEDVDPLIAMLRIVPPPEGPERSIHGDRPAEAMSPLAPVAGPPHPPFDGEAGTELCSDRLVVFQPGESLPGGGPNGQLAGHGGPSSAGVTSRIFLTSRFDVGALLGDDLRDALGALAIDSASGDILQRIVDIAIRAAHAESGSLLLVDEDGSSLRIAAARGLSPDVVNDTRIRIGHGMAGEVFKTGEARLIRGRISDRSDRGRTVHPEAYDAAVVPVLHEGRAIGVLCVNQSAAADTFSDRTVVLLSRFAHEAALAILKAIDLAGLPEDQRVPALERQIERLMSLKESLTQRLRTVADTVRRAYRADFAHVFLVDPVGRRLEMITGPLSMTQGQPRFIPLGQGFLSWVVERGAARVTSLWDEASNSGRAVVYLPVGGEGRVGLLVFESVPLADPSTGRLLEQLARVSELVSELIILERGLESGELLSELRMRVADETGRLSHLLPHERARAVLQFSIDLLAAETAVWVPSADSRPIWSRPGGTLSVRLQAEFRPILESIADEVRERGRIAGVASAEKELAAPAGPAPYLGVATGQQGGVLLLLFSPDEEGGTTAQIPASTLLDTLHEIGELFPGSLLLHGMDAAAA